MTERHIFFDTDMLQFEVESTLGTDPAGEKTVIKAFDIGFDPAPKFHDIPYQKHDNYRGPDIRIRGAGGGKLKFKLHQRYISLDASHVENMIAACGYHTTNPVGSLTYYDQKNNLPMESGTNSTTMVIANASASDLTVGMAVLHKPSTGTPSTRWIIKKEIGAINTTLTFNAAFATAPDAARDTDELMPMTTFYPYGLGDGIFNSGYSFYLDHGAAASAWTDYIRWKILGCCGIWKIASWPAGGLPVFEFDFDCDNYSFAETAGTSTDNDVAKKAFPLFGSRMYFNGSAIDIKNFSFDPGWKLTPLEAHSGANGRSGWVYGATDPKMEIDPMHDIDFLTYYESAAEKDVFFENTPASGLYSTSVWMRGACIDNAPPENSDNITRRKLSLVGRDPGQAVQETLTGDGLLVNLPKWAIAFSHCDLT